MYMPFCHQQNDYTKMLRQNLRYYYGANLYIDDYRLHRKYSEGMQPKVIVYV